MAGERIAAQMIEAWLTNGIIEVSTLDELRTACEQHQVRELKGFGEKTEEHILAGIALASAAGERMLWADADTIVQDVLAHLRICKSIEVIEPPAPCGP